MVDLWGNEKGPFQVLFGDDASLDPKILIPIMSVVFVVLIIIALRIIISDKGRSEMTEEELAKDRARFDERMEKRAKFEGKEYIPERARAAEAAEIAEANKRYGRKPDDTEEGA